MVCSFPEPATTVRVWGVIAAPVVSLISQLILDGMAMGLVYVILAAGLVLIMSVSRIFLIAYGQFYMIGAYVVWAGVALLNLPFFMALLMAVLTTAILGLLSYRLIFQYIQYAERQFLVVIVAAIGLMMILCQSGLLLFGTIPRGVPPVFPDIISVAGVNIPLDKLVLIVLALLITVALFLVYEKTKIGRAMRAVAFLPEAASLQGIDSKKICLIVLGIGSALAGVAGGIMVPSYSAHPEMGTNIFLPVMLIMMLGGMDSLLGAIPSGLIFGLTLSFGQYFIGGRAQILLFVVIGIIVFFRPAGLLGRGFKLGI